MNVYVLYIRDYTGAVRNLAAIDMNVVEVMHLCQTLNDKCYTADGRFEFDEIIHIANKNGIELTRSLIKEIQYGSYFMYKKVPLLNNINYQDFYPSWDESGFDAYTSDWYYGNYDEDEDEDEADNEDLHFDYSSGCYYNVDLKHINQHKLEKLVDGKKYKKFDKEFAHPDVTLAYAYFDPLHDFAHNKGFNNAVKHIKKIMFKLIKPCAMVHEVVDALKNNIKYKNRWEFKTYADWIIDALQSNNLEKHDFYFRDYEIRDNCIWKKDHMFTYLGYGYTRKWYTLNFKKKYYYVEISK